MTWPRVRLQEAIVDKFCADAPLVEMTCEGVRDSVGTLHHIGILLTEAGMKGRTPYLGIQIGGTRSAITGTARAHLFRSEIMVHVSAADECLTNKIMDRVQYLLTTPEDDCCNGYCDFTNAHIKTHNAEFQQRMATNHDPNLDVYMEMLEFSVVWSDVPCNEIIIEPYCGICELPGLYQYDEIVICDYDCMI